MTIIRYFKTILASIGFALAVGILGTLAAIFAGPNGYKTFLKALFKNK